MPSEIDKLASANYLGDIKVVSGLLRNFAHEFLTKEYKDADEFGPFIDRSSRSLARLLLGENKDYPGPPWNSPGQIDVYVARECRIESDSSEERVAGGIIQMAGKLLELVQDNDPQWKVKSGKILAHYTYLLMGIPAEVSPDAADERIAPTPTGALDGCDGSLKRGSNSNSRGDEMATNEGKSNERKLSHGSCSFERTSPPREDLSPQTPKLNVIIAFDEALKLQLALQDWLLKANKLRKNATEGKLAAVDIVIDLVGNSISIVPEKLKAKKPSKPG